MVESIKNQTKQIFQNIDILFENIPENEFNTIKGGFKTWKHFYHLLYSLDKNFIDPSNFIEPGFQKKNLNIIYMDDNNILTKEDLTKYYGNVKSKIQNYLEELNVELLDDKIVFHEMNLSKLELILAQLRHIFYHIGYLHCCIKMEKGETPEYIGLYKVLPEK